MRAFITGAGSGIGRATALRIAAAGGGVALFDRDADAIRELAGTLESSGTATIALPGDVTSEADLEAAVGAAVEHLGGLDSCVASAGVEVSGPFSSLTLEDWSRVFAVNVTGVMLTARAALPALIAEPAAALVAIASTAGLAGSAGYAAYSASKHAVIGLTKSLAIEYGPRGVRSNMVCPSITNTPMGERVFAGASAEQVRGWEAAIPLGRFAEPADVAAVILHLLGPDASYTNGAVYVVDGGATAGSSAFETD